MRTVGRYLVGAVALVVLLPALRAGHTPAAELPELVAPKEATKCQKALLDASRAFLAAKLEALERCASAAFTCIQVKGSAQKCLDKAKTKCAPDALDAIARAEAKFVDKVSSACGSPRLSSTDLRDADALGFDTRDAECSEILSGACAGSPDPACARTDDLVGLAGCLDFAYARAAESLFGIAQARARELLGVANVAPELFPELPDHGGDGAAIVGPEDAGKRVAACARAIAKGGATLADAVGKAVTGCVTGVLDCSKRTPPKRDQCLADAAVSCLEVRPSLAKKRRKIATRIDQKCASGVIAFDTLRNASAANLDALACECESVGIEAIDGLAAFEQCLARQHECRLGRLATLAAPRTDDLLALVGLELSDLVCASQSPTSTALRSGTPYRPLVFGSGILRFIKGITRLSGIVHGTFLRGRPPLSLRGAPHTIRSLTYPSGRPRARRGGSSLFRVRFGGLTKATGATLEVGAARAAQPPELIVGVRRADGALVDGHFRVPLSSPDQSDVGTDDVEIDFPIELSTCAFDITVATVATDGEIGAYVDAEVVPDLRAPIDATPTPESTQTTHEPSATPTVPATPSLTATTTPAPTITPTASANATASATPTASAAPTRTPTPTATTTRTATRTPTHTPTRTRTPTPTPTTTPNPCANVTVVPGGGGFFSRTTNGTSALQGTGACGGSESNGPERVFAWTPTLTGLARAHTCDPETSFFSQIYVRSLSCTGMQVGCGGTSFCPGNQNGVILDFPVTAGTTYYIVVDGALGTSGAFRLAVLPPLI